MFSRSLNLNEQRWVRTYLGTKWGIPFTGPKSTISASGVVSVGTFVTATLEGTIFNEIQWQRGTSIGPYFNITSSDGRSTLYQVNAADSGLTLRCVGTNIDGINVVSNVLT